MEMATYKAWIPMGFSLRDNHKIKQFLYKLFEFIELIQVVLSIDLAHGAHPLPHPPSIKHMKSIIIFDLREPLLVWL